MVKDVLEIENSLKKEAMDEVNILKPIMNEINHAKRILKISNLQIYIVPRIHIDVNGSIYVTRYPCSGKNEEFQKALGLATSITDGPIYNKNIIVLSYYNFDGIHPLTNAERLAVLLHEMRHIWQKQYHTKEYAEIARGNDCILNKAEIDADAFALAYLDVYNPYEVTSYITIFLAVLNMDNDRRFKRADKLVAELKQNCINRV